MDTFSFNGTASSATHHIQSGALDKSSLSQARCWLTFPTTIFEVNFLTTIGHPQIFLTKVYNTAKMPQEISDIKKVSSPPTLYSATICTLWAKIDKVNSSSRFADARMLHVRFHYVRILLSRLELRSYRCLLKRQGGGLRVKYKDW